MLVKWIKKYLPTEESIEHSRELGEIKAIQKPSLWKYDCQTTARGVGVGLFVAVLPVPFQMLLAVLISIVLRANLPLAILFTWASNPITFIPQLYLTYYLGSLITGETLKDLKIPDLDFHWSQLGLAWHSLIVWLGQFGKTFFVGLPIMAFGIALVGYLTVIILWKCGIIAGRK